MLNVAITPRTTMARFKRLEWQEALGDWSDLIPYVGPDIGATLVWLESRNPGDPPISLLYL